MIQKQKQNKIQCKTFFFSRALFPKTAVHPEAESSRSQCRDCHRQSLRLGSRKAPDRRGSQPGWSGPPKGPRGLPMVQSRDKQWQATFPMARSNNSEISTRSRQKAVASNGEIAYLSRLQGRYAQGQG